MKVWIADGDIEGERIADTSKARLLKQVRDSGGRWHVRHCDIGKVNSAKIIALLEGTGFVEKTLEEFEYGESD